MVKKIAEKFNRLSRVHQRLRQTTDNRQTTDGIATAISERERKFTSAKNSKAISYSEFSSDIDIIDRFQVPYSKLKD